MVSLTVLFSPTDCVYFIFYSYNLVMIFFVKYILAQFARFEKQFNLLFQNFGL